VNIYFRIVDLSLYLRTRDIKDGNYKNVFWSEIMFLLVVSEHLPVTEHVAVPLAEFQI
jgi:hypothetical protein